MTDTTLAQPEYLDELQAKVKTLHDSVWDRHATWPHVTQWLAQFGATESLPSEASLHALYLLSHFMYFSMVEIRGLLRSLYRDVFRASMLAGIRRAHADTLDEAILRANFDSELEATRFIPLGNPSESSALLLYYFRQENRLHKNLFANTSDLFDPSEVSAGGNIKLRCPELRHYVFLDDLCGSGQQVEEYSGFVPAIKAFNPEAKAYFYTLFGLVDGIEHIRRLNRFDVVHSLVGLDSTFKSFAPGSRIYSEPDQTLTRLAGLKTMQFYGAKLWPAHPLGYQDGQLLLAFFYNTPDNTLPVFWSEGSASAPWVPIFKRYHKI
nr:hypothetical protein [uncultured Rhodopila sp.]